MSQYIHVPSFDQQQTIPKKSTIKTHQCDFEGCQSAFTRRHDLNRHMERVHQHKKNHFCSIDTCTAGFYDKSHLNEHVKRVHLKERNFVCEIDGCANSFYEKSHLDEHIRRVHLKERNFQCNFDGCGKGFYSRSDLTRHIKTVHDKIEDELRKNTICMMPPTTEMNAIQALCYQKGFICEIIGCGFVSRTESENIAHMLSHAPNSQMNSHLSVLSSTGCDTSDDEDDHETHSVFSNNTNPNTIGNISKDVPLSFDPSSVKRPMDEGFIEVVDESMPKRSKVEDDVAV